MSEEVRREAKGLHHFVSGTRRKIFVCGDRREVATLQGEVQKLERRKACNIKRYEDEIKDWKEILMQLQNEKQGAESIQCLIESNSGTFKSSLATRKQNAIKSIRRSLAPHLPQDVSNKRTVNQKLFSKPPLVPRKIKVELLRREQVRLNEEKLSANQIESRKSENTNAFLDDAVAMYGKLRREITAPHIKREIKSIGTASKETRPISVPSSFKGMGSRELEDYLKPNKLERSKTFDGFSTNAHRKAPPRSQKKRDNGKFTPINNVEKTDLKRTVNSGKNAQKRPKITDKCKICSGTQPHKTGRNISVNPLSKSKEKLPDKESQADLVSVGVIRIPTVHFATKHPGGQNEEESDEKGLQSKAENNNEDMNNNCRIPTSKLVNQEGHLLEEESSLSHSSNEASHPISYLNKHAQSIFRNQQERFRSQSDGASSVQNDKNHRTRSQELKSQALLKTGASRSRKDSTESKIEENESTEAAVKEVNARKQSTTGSSRRHSQPSSISTSRLAEIISKQILGHVTNAKKRLSISSNQKTSILKSYGRMLQNQLNMDDVPDCDSPDFSETPFMRSKKDQNEVKNYPKINKHRMLSPNRNVDQAHWSLPRHQLQLGALQSSLDYSEIGEENVLKDKERRRLSVPFFGAAGITTRKERAARLTKLKLKYKESTVDEKNDARENIAKESVTTTENDHRNANRIL